jgi:SAM-dependent methyltransferase
MDATTTLAEIARILRPGGVFAAYDYDWPPVCNWEVEAAFTEMVRRVGMLRPLEGQPRHTKDMHLERMRDSGQFRFVREIVLHSRERGNAARIIGMALSLGPLVVLLDRGMTEDELGLAQLRETATRALGTESSQWFISYRVRLGVK